MDLHGRSPDPAAQPSGSIPRLGGDALDHPHLFVWHGPLPEAPIAAWCANQGGWPIVSDLAAIWRSIGPGELFETEALLGPDLTDDDIDTTNRHLWDTGMPDRLVAFHTGSWASAFDRDTGEIVSLDDRLQVRYKLSSMAEWYEGLRREFGDRYGLRP